MGDAAARYGVSPGFIKELFKRKKLRRYKIEKLGKNACTMIDCVEFEKLIIEDPTIKVVAK